jgi:large repetitive protein
MMEVKGGKRPFAYQVDNGAWVSDTLFTNLAGGAHTVVMKDKNGCTTSLTFTVETIDEIEIPNGFTPNGDGMNDVWVLKNLSVLYPKCKVMVFNRWGVEVFRSTGYGQEWDGTINGKNLPDGTYYCIIELGEGKAPLRKSVTIMR